jgi:hypothetical protein
LARRRLAGDLEDDARLAERVLAGRDRVDAEVAEAGLPPDGGVDRAEDRVACEKENRAPPPKVICFWLE